LAGVQVSINTGGAPGDANPRKQVAEVSLTRFHLTISASWFVALSAGLILRLALGGPVSLAFALAVLLLGCLPVIVLVFVFQGPPPKTIAEVLYDAGQEAGPGRAALARIERRADR
jgi:hypothetical protein